jgi:hypothetical protein
MQLPNPAEKCMIVPLVRCRKNSVNIISKNLTELIVSPQNMGPIILTFTAHHMPHEEVLREINVD